MRARKGRGLAGHVVLAALVLTWVFFAPPQLGGSTLFSATVGNSMEPMFHKGDLAVVRRASSYQVGDVVLYESPVLHRPVLHRILVIQNGHYFFKGDNNDFVDPGYAVRGDLLGKLWFKAGHAGRVLNWFGVPTHAAVLAGIAASFLLLGGRAKKGRRRRRGRGRTRRGSRRAPVTARSPVSTNVSRHLHRPRKSAENIFGTVAFLLAVVLLGVGFGTSLKRSVPVAGYHQAGSFSYMARTAHPASAYPTGIASTGDPLFLADFKKITVGFSYKFSSRLAHDVRGTVVLKALISSDSNWHDLIVLQQRTPFSGDVARVSGVFDLTKLQALIDQISVESGAVGGEYKVDLQPVVHVTGFVGGKRISSTFAPVLPITITASLFKLDIAPAAAPPGATYAPPTEAATLATGLDPSETGTIPGFAPNYVSLVRYHFAISAVRGFGLGLAGLALLALVSKAFKRKRELWTPERRIAHRFGSVFVDVVSLGDSHSLALTSREVPDFESLATLAQYCERPILRQKLGQFPAYAVEDDGRLYVYRPALRPPQPVVASPTAEPAPRIEALPAPLPPPRAPRSARRRFARPAGMLFGLALAATLITSFTATNTVPLSHAGVLTQPVDLGQLTPTQCAAIAAQHLLVTTTGTATGTSQNDLILGAAGTGTFNLLGVAGDDCIVGGGGAGTTNKFDGGPGTDVCIGAAGATNTFKNCETTL